MSCYPFVMDTAVTEPFNAPRAAARILFDFAAMAACIKESSAPILDFGAGSGWLSELIARMGYDVVAYDVHGDIGRCVANRIDADKRIPRDHIRAADGRGLTMPFDAGTFGTAVELEAAKAVSGATVTTAAINAQRSAARRMIGTPPVILV